MGARTVSGGDRSHPDRAALVGGDSGDADLLENNIVNDGRLLRCDQVFEGPCGLLGSDLPSGGNESSAMDFRGDAGV